ncbi:alpha-(1,3)-fucosyltransferase C isoform X1 [Cephus cinctus]|uniref:Fucosyltransferase n=1 Tax=Cephus cinctus TaxID=211228 RepID=A0AAJ7BLC9_CEPCN|nr:alpha-(1,3)-fucosyltransferase C isoform X1 [Cephus cinctus]XP_015588973.1 alpha-(1,3)-fucosyltransferase C isoform X1 [Cephus cinctus]XP_015588974.1 alpha-(1,3)-fucosyltransferase C isoform X1 [Cephus cinctus]XP_015588975.1 alpha-(1,3)-fucosyltransferase C isoform X1 [Cephus cinctus]XP_015588976.1 alpha-(1,3)-fucosyltransferase C isoform X1 [Cephus cinctus]
MYRYLTGSITFRVYTVLLIVSLTVLCFIILKNNFINDNSALYNRQPMRVLNPADGVEIISKNEDITSPRNLSKRMKTILYWTMMFKSKNFYFGDGDIFLDCPIFSCLGTNDRNYQPVENFDAILFHGPELNYKDLPKKRSPHQRYIFMNSETQIYHPIPNHPTFNNFFNWTITYRRDADIMRPYGVVKIIKTNEIIPPYLPAVWKNLTDTSVPKEIDLIVQNKTKMAAWFVSNCFTSSRRENVVKRLQKYMDIDIYGKCGKLECPREIETECYEKLNDNYFFYLSFENSLCRDYLTEKVFRVLEYNVIPVVYGSADYSTFLPPDSYINARDFASLEELAKFLKALVKDTQRYLSYFKWKSHYYIDTSKRYINCQLCEALHNNNEIRNQTYKDIYRWWTIGSGCESGPKL